MMNDRKVLEGIINSQDNPKIVSSPQERIKANSHSKTNWLQAIGYAAILLAGIFTVSCPDKNNEKQENSQANTSVQDSGSFKADKKIQPDPEVLKVAEEPELSIKEMEMFLFKRSHKNDLFSDDPLIDYKSSQKDKDSSDSTQAYREYLEERLKWHRRSLKKEAAFGLIYDIGKFLPELKSDMGGLYTSLAGWERRESDINAGLGYFIKAVDEYISSIESEFREKSRELPDLSQLIEDYEDLIAKAKKLRISGSNGVISPDRIDWAIRMNLDYMLNDEKDVLERNEEFMKIYNRQRKLKAEIVESGIITFYDKEYTDKNWIARMFDVYNFIIAFADDSKVKEYIFQNNLLQKLFEFHKDIIECNLGLRRLDVCHDCEDHYTLLAVAGIINVYGKELWPEIEKMDLVGYATDILKTLNKNRDTLNILDYENCFVADGEYEAHVNLAYKKLIFQDISMQASYYCGGDKALYKTLLALCTTLGKEDGILEQMREQGTIEQVMKRITLFMTGEDWISTKGGIQEFMENLSRVYGSKLIPLLKEANLDLDLDKVDFDRLRKLGIRDEDINLGVEYGNGLRWLVENFDQYEGSYWHAIPAVKGACSDRLTWTFYNILSTASEDEKKEIFSLMDETGFEKKYPKIIQRLRNWEESKTVSCAETREVIEEIGDMYEAYRSER